MKILVGEQNSTRILLVQPTNKICIVCSKIDSIWLRLTKIISLRLLLKFSRNSTANVIGSRIVNNNNNNNNNNIFFLIIIQNFIEHFS